VQCSAGHVEAEEVGRGHVISHALCTVPTERVLMAF